jgi:hypothetical protein
MLPRSSQIRPKLSTTDEEITFVSPVREAAAEFVRGTTFGWSRRDLAHWLVRQYSPCLVADAVVHPDGDPAELPPSAPEGLEEERVERLILDARSSVLRLLADLAWPSEAGVRAKRAIAAGHVIATLDNQGRRHWGPVGRKRMRLADRVASLFLADALEHPLDYPGVSLCRSCGELGFGARSAHQRECDHVRRVA